MHTPDAGVRAQQGDADLTTPATRFETQRPRQLGLAYRMLGSRADAEDVVQDAWLKWSQTDHQRIDNDAAFLTTITTRLCLDRLKHESMRRQAYVGPWLPEPITDAIALSAQSASELADDLSYALLLALERLTAPERAAFLLHDVFDCPFADIATVLERNEASVRQLAARARKAVRAAKPARAAVTPEMHQNLLIAFMTALGSGDVNRLKNLLRDDAVLISDGGGKKIAASRPVHGVDSIVRLLLGTFQQNPLRIESISTTLTQINGDSGALIYIDGVLEQTFTISVEGERIDAIYVVRNPDKLTRLPTSSNRASSFINKH